MSFYGCLNEMHKNRNFEIYLGNNIPDLNLGLYTSFGSWYWVKVLSQLPSQSFEFESWVQAKVLCHAFCAWFLIPIFPICWNHHNQVNKFKFKKKEQRCEKGNENEGSKGRVFDFLLKFIFHLTSCFILLIHYKTFEFLF